MSRTGTKWPDAVRTDIPAFTVSICRDPSAVSKDVPAAKYGATSAGVAIFSNLAQRKLPLLDRDTWHLH
ncbi:MAG: hypothetical protein JXQ85_03365 [Cognatishimia sp.]